MADDARNASGSLILIRPEDSDRIVAAVTSLQGWTDVSGLVETGEVGLTGVVHTTGAAGPRRFTGALAGSSSGTMPFGFRSTPGDTVDVKAIFDDIWASRSRRLQMVIQTDRESLINNTDAKHCLLYTSPSPRDS